MFKQQFDLNMHSILFRGGGGEISPGAVPSNSAILDEFSELYQQQSIKKINIQDPIYYFLIKCTF